MAFTFKNLSTKHSYQREVYLNGTLVGEITRYRRTRHGAKHIDYKFASVDGTIVVRSAWFKVLVERIEAALPSGVVTAVIEDLPTDLPAVNIECLRTYLNFMKAELNILRARTLDDAETILTKLCASQNLFLYRGGDHLAVHMFSGHEARMLFVKVA